MALAQVAGASVLAGVLDAGVDGHGAVFALRRTGKTAGWEAFSGCQDPRDAREFLASSGMRLGRWQGALGLRESQGEPWPLVTLQRAGEECGEFRSLGSGPTASQSSHALSVLNHSAGAWAVDAGKPGFMLQLHLFPIVWS